MQKEEQKVDEEMRELAGAQASPYPGLEDLDGALLQTMSINVGKKNHARATTLEDAAAWERGGFLVRRGTAQTGNKMALTAANKVAAASVLNEKTEFFQGKSSEYVPGMRAQQMNDYLEKRKIRLQSSVYKALESDLPIGRDTAGENAGAELMLLMFDGRVDCSNTTWEWRPETFLEGIDSETTIRVMRDNQFHASYNKMQMQIQLHKGPWTAVGRNWLKMLYGKAWVSNMMPGQRPVVQFFTGVEEASTVQERCERIHRYRTGIELVVQPPAAPGPGADGAPERDAAFAGLRAAIGFPNDVPDVQLTYSLTREQINAHNVSNAPSNIVFELVWTLKKVALTTVRAPAGPVLSCSTINGIIPQQVLLRESAMHPLLVDACKCLQQMDWLTGYVRADAIGQTAVRLAFEVGDAGLAGRRDAVASLHRYWVTHWNGTGCVNRSIMQAMSRLVMTAGEDAADIVWGDADAARRGVAHDEVGLNAGVNAFRHCTARTQYETASVSPLVVYAVETGHVVKQKHEKWDFPETADGIKAMLCRCATITSLYVDSAFASALWGCDGTVFGVGWDGAGGNWDTETGREIIVDLEKRHEHAWNDAFGRATSLVVLFDETRPSESGMGHNALVPNVQEIMCVQRLPTYAWAAYSTAPYLPQHEPPELGGKFWVKQIHNAPAGVQGQYYNITKYISGEDKVVHITERGNLEDEANWPYRVALLQGGSYASLVSLASVAAIDAAMPADVRDHNRGMVTVPWKLTDMEDMDEVKLLIKARSPPQPGGMSCLGHSCIPVWMADAPSYGKPAVSKKHLDSASSVLAFRR